MTYEKHFQTTDAAANYEQDEYRPGSYPSWLTVREEELMAEMFMQYGLAESGRLLDFACGTGRFLPLLSRVGTEVTGVDISSQMLDIARRRAGHSAELVVADVRTPDGRDSVGGESEYDGGCAMRFILNTEYENAVSCLRGVRHILKGDAVFLVNNHSRPLSHKVVSALRSRLKRQRMVVGNTLSDRSAGTIFEAAGFEVLGTVGYGLLGGRLWNRLGEGRAIALETRMPAAIQKLIGSHRLYALSPISRAQTAETDAYA